MRGVGCGVSTPPPPSVFFSHGTEGRELAHPNYVSSSKNPGAGSASSPAHGSSAPARSPGLHFGRYEGRWGTRLELLCDTIHHYVTHFRHSIHLCFCFCMRRRSAIDIIPYPRVIPMRFQLVLCPTAIQSTSHLKHPLCLKPEFQ